MIEILANPIAEASVQKAIAIQLIEPRKLKPTAIDFALTNPGFAIGYQNSQDVEAKYAIAYALVEDGRYSDPLSLLQNFNPSKAVIEQLSIERQQELAKRGKEYKDSLSVLMMQKGVLDPDAEEAMEAETEVGKVIDRNDVLTRLRGILPIHVMGAITNAVLFDGVSDEKKREKLRGWTTKALLRPYLGDLVVQPPTGDIEFHNLVQLIPDHIFQNIDSATLQIARSYFVNQAMRLFNEGEEVGTSRLSDLTEKESSIVKRLFLEEVLAQFQEVQAVQVPGRFVSLLQTWTDEASVFPHFRQKYFVNEFLKTRKKLLNGDTGGGKTASAYLAMEAVGVSRVTIFGPAKARNTWPREAERIFRQENRPDVFTIQSVRDLDDIKVETAEYVYVGSELMGQAWGNAELYSKIKSAVVDRRKTDGVILDESDEFRSEGAGCSKMLMDIVSKIRNNFSKEQFFEMPMIALTATPITASLEDLNITMALLYPERFSLPKRYEKDKFTFSTQALNDPQIAYSLLFGEQLMIQWSLEDMYGDRVEQLELRPDLRVKVEVKPSEYAIYQWVSSLPLGTFAKTRLLRSVLLNPDLIKRSLRQKELLPKPTRSIEELEVYLQRLHTTWMQWMLEKHEEIPDEQFSADWVAKYDQSFLLECFFDDRLVEGIESLASRSSFIKEDWQKRDAVSGKYRYARELIKNTVKLEDSKYVASGKVFFVSPYHKRGITRFIDDAQIKDSDLDDNAWSFYEHIFTEWLPGLPRDMASNIDGTRSFVARDRHAKLWREEGDRDVIEVASLDAVNESMDWATRDTPRNTNIQKIKVAYFGWPYSWEEFKQMGGRFLRPGLEKGIDIDVLEAENTLDQGMYDLVRRKYLLSQIALAGVKLDKDDLEFFRGSTEAKRILLAQPNVGQFFLQDVIRKLKGRGEQEGVDQLSREQNGKSFFELFAEFYFDEGRDEFRVVGNNAELAKSVALRFNPQKVISVGAGTCLFARKLREAEFEGQIDNVDINGAILRIAKERFPQIGNIVVEGASSLGAASEAYDLADYSFILPWTKLYDNGKLAGEVHEIERVKVLLKMNDVLKRGGKAILTFPESSFDEETFAHFVNAATKHFGFKTIDPSGISHATDMEPKRRIGWIITLEKTDEPSLSGFDPHAIAFYNELETISKYKVKKRHETAVVVNVEYPIFSSKEFEVYNPLTKSVVSAGSVIAGAEELVFSAAEMVVTIKEALTLEQLKIWNRARREIVKGLERGYKDAEEMLAGVLKRKGLDKISEWNEQVVQRVIAAEIRRLRR